MGEYTTIATYLRGRFRPLHGPNDQAYAPADTLSITSASADFLAASPLPEPVNNFLLQLDAKLDTLLNALYSSSLEKDFPHTMEINAISAAKLHFSTDIPLAQGDWIEVVITFGQVGFTTASGIGKVIAREVSPSGTPFFVFSFTRILEEDREKIIRYVFKEERRLLRETRLE